MTAFENALQHTLGVEGGWSDHRLDPGGRTRFGITERIAEKYGYDVETLTVNQARDVYRRAFWRPLRLDDVAAIGNGRFEPLAAEMFDSGVNTGVTRTRGGWRVVHWLQLWLNRLNKGYHLHDDPDWPVLAVDGLIGPATLGALRGFDVKRRHLDGARVLVTCLNVSQGAYYAEITDRRPAEFSAFIYGWMRTRVMTSAE